MDCSCDTIHASIHIACVSLFCRSGWNSIRGKSRLGISVRTTWGHLSPGSLVDILVEALLFLKIFVLYFFSHLRCSTHLTWVQWGPNTVQLLSTQGDCQASCKDLSLQKSFECLKSAEGPMSSLNLWGPCWFVVKRKWWAACCSRDIVLAMKVAKNVTSELKKT